MRCSRHSSWLSLWRIRRQDLTRFPSDSDCTSQFHAGNGQKKHSLLLCRRLITGIETVMAMHSGLKIHLCSFQESWVAEVDGWTLIFLMVSRITRRWGVMSCVKSFEGNARRKKTRWVVPKYYIYSLQSLVGSICERSISLFCLCKLFTYWLYFAVV